MSCVMTRHWVGERREAGAPADVFFCEGRLCQSRESSGDDRDAPSDGPNYWASERSAPSGTCPPCSPLPPSRSSAASA